MKNLELPDIKVTGERHVEQWLADNGYSNILKENIQTDEHGLKATGSIENILVIVRAFLHPHRPFKLSDYEVDQLTRRADKQKLIAYAAYVVLNKSGNLMEEINWERLS
ncbi:MAG: hypothetical protein ABI685_04760 [Ferruginibacter sp.]